MTTSRVAEIERRGPGRPAHARSFEERLSARLLARSAELTPTVDDFAWPSAKYRADPVAFFREVLGVEPWSRQIEVIEAVRDCPRVAVASGHKVSKSHTAAGIALWYYCSSPDARVVMSSTTSRQVDQILWRELRMMVARGGRCVVCKASDPDSRGPRPCPHSGLIDGEIHELARSGLKARDFREIVGFTAKEAEAVAGVSGKHLLYILDEASGIDDAIFEAIEGNRAGGARIVMFSNPTKCEGEFFEAFNSKHVFYKCIRISSEETPNVVEGREVIPGLATRAWIEEKREEWGEESALYKIRVKGQHVTKEEGKILSVHDIAKAERRWADAPAEGRLFIGLDPAGPSGMGDESVFAPRRGLKVLGLTARRGLTEAGYLVELLGLIKLHRRPREPAPVVIIDREGLVGSKVYGILCAHLDSRQDDFELVGVRSSELADGGVQHRLHDRVRDKLWANLAQWLREGGAIPEDARLAKELHTPSWVPNDRARLKVTPKDDIRKAIGRSPDRADAVALAVWETAAIRREAEAPPPAEEPDMPALDPYGGLDVWRQR